MGIVRLIFDRLRDAGDAPPPTLIKHYFLFADQPSADLAAQHLRQRRFDVELRKDEDGACTILAGHAVVLSTSAIEHVTEFLEDLAAEHGGEYDGWSTA